MDIIFKAFKITLGILLALFVVGFILKCMSDKIDKTKQATPTPSSLTYTKPDTITTQKPLPKYIRYYKGKKGGCYYVNDKGKKVYVDAVMCR